jgi:hypothetical protein
MLRRVIFCRFIQRFSLWLRANRSSQRAVLSREFGARLYALAGLKRSVVSDTQRGTRSVVGLRHVCACRAETGQGSVERQTVPRVADFTRDRADLRSGPERVQEAVADARAATTSRGRS